MIFVVGRSEAAVEPRSDLGLAIVLKAVEPIAKRVEALLDGDHLDGLAHSFPAHSRKTERLEPFLQSIDVVVAHFVRRAFDRLGFRRVRPDPGHDRILKHFVESDAEVDALFAAQRDQDIGEIGDHSAAIIAAQPSNPSRPPAGRRLRRRFLALARLVETDDLAVAEIGMIAQPFGPFLVAEIVRLIDHRGAPRADDRNSPR